MERQEKSGKATSKGQNLTIRVSPRMKFELDLLSRSQHRSITAILEWLVAQAAVAEISWEKLGLKPQSDAVAGQRLLDCLWDPDETKRLAKLAKHAPGLMSFEQELAWRLICNEPNYWIEGLFQSLPEPLAGKTPEELASQIVTLFEAHQQKAAATGQK